MGWVRPSQAPGSACAPASLGDGDLLVDPTPPVADEILATLGPSGTSSEAAAHRLAKRLGGQPDPLSGVSLHPTYELAYKAVLKGEASRLVVANAYAGVNAFYMDERLRLERAFVFDTPGYGIAAGPGRPIPLLSRLVTHPAPEQLIHTLIPPGYIPSTVEHVASTSVAAARVAEGSADLALTTTTSAHVHGLRFISPLRDIRMLWSVFMRARRPRWQP